VGDTAAGAVLTIAVGAALPPHAPAFRPPVRLLAAMEAALVLEYTDTATATRNIAEGDWSVNGGGVSD